MAGEYLTAKHLAQLIGGYPVTETGVEDSALRGSAYGGQRVEFKTRGFCGSPPNHLRMVQ